MLLKRLRDQTSVWTGIGNALFRINHISSIKFQVPNNSKINIFNGEIQVKGKKYATRSLKKQYFHSIFVQDSYTINYSINHCSDQWDLTRLAHLLPSAWTGVLRAPMCSCQSLGFRRLLNLMAITWAEMKTLQCPCGQVLVANWENQDIHLQRTGWEIHFTDTSQKRTRTRHGGMRAGVGKTPASIFLSFLGLSVSAASIL